MDWVTRIFGVGRVADSSDLVFAVERAVELVEPRLKQVGGYPERYYEAVRHALDYARSLAARLPGPVHVSRESYASNPLVHALFATAADIDAALCVSQSMREYRRVHPDSDDVYALICMRRGTKALLGMALEGDVLRRDVPQQAIYFTDHTLADAGATEVQARARIAWGLFESLAKHVRLRLELRRHRKNKLEQARDECLIRLRGAEAERRNELEAALRRVLRRLGVVNELLELGRHGADFDAVLKVPERYVYLERTRVALDHMGVLIPPDAGGTEVEFCDLVGRDRRRWTAAVMYCDRVRDAAAESDRFLLAERWLGL